nr:MAG TPA: hypothetical protein [Caudoviricetes sp.]
MNQFKDYIYSRYSIPQENPWKFRTLSAGKAMEIPHVKSFHFLGFTKLKKCMKKY